MSLLTLTTVGGGSAGGFLLMRSMSLDVPTATKSYWQRVRNGRPPYASMRERAFFVGARPTSKYAVLSVQRRASAALLHRSEDSLQLQGAELHHGETGSKLTGPAMANARQLYPLIAVEAVALPKSSALCQLTHAPQHGGDADCARGLTRIKKPSDLSIGRG